MATWLVKSEPSTYSIDDFEREKKTLWEGVRNYQARNYLREMKKGERVLFYHSNAKEIGIVGVGKVSKEALPDPSQFDPKSKYYDEGSNESSPRWVCPELQFLHKFSKVLTRDELSAQRPLRDMVILQKGSRLSVTPVSEDEYQEICSLAGWNDA